ncbi:MAG: DUF87 domain-containing protein [Bacteroidetes bacterium]|nr:MAG: DUF87 domain-containing protein [Bacteroidota bacterium]
MKIGKIISVEYDKFRVKLFHTTRNSTVNIKGKVYYFGNIGSFLKIENATGDTVICEVVSVLDNTIEGKLVSDYDLDSSRELIIKPVGTLYQDRKFNMGVGIFPSIYSDVYIVVKEDVEDILATTILTEGDGGGDAGIHRELEIGVSKNMINYRVKLNIDKLFNIHSAVLGNSGSGKSNTISHIFQEIFRQKEYYALGAKVVLFDVNGEYSRAFSTDLEDEINVVFYKPNFVGGILSDFVLPYYLMNLEEWTAFLMTSDRTQRPFWDRVLQECYKFYKIKTANDDEKENFINYFRYKLHNIVGNILSRVDSDTANITTASSALRKIKEILTNEEFVGIQSAMELVADINTLLENCVIVYGQNDARLSNKLVEIQDKIDVDSAMDIYDKKLPHGEYYDHKFLKIAAEIVLLDEEAKGNGRIREFTSTMMSRLDHFIYNKDCEFMKKSTGNEVNSEEDYLKKFFSLVANDDGKQLIIIDSSETSSDILELMTSVISRLIFDYRKRQVGELRRKKPVHLVLDEAHRYIRKNADYILKENIFEKIAREGRKFSTFLIVSSQRPSELSETVLSQCGNYIIHRIQNEVDMKYIYSVLPYFSTDYVNKIKQSTPGEALIFGNCVPMPLHVKVNQANPEPNSENCKVSEEWYREPFGNSDEEDDSDENEQDPLF